MIGHATQVKVNLKFHAEKRCEAWWTSSHEKQNEFGESWSHCWTKISCSFFSWIASIFDGWKKGVWWVYGWGEGGSKMRALHYGVPVHFIVHITFYYLWYKMWYTHTHTHKMHTKTCVHCTCIHTSHSHTLTHTHLYLLVLDRFLDDLVSGLHSQLPEFDHHVRQLEMVCHSHWPAGCREERVECV